MQPLGKRMNDNRKESKLDTLTMKLLTSLLFFASNNLNNALRGLGVKWNLPLFQEAVTVPLVQFDTLMRGSSPTD